MQPGPVDWLSIDRSLSEVYGLTPAAIDRMTMSEIACLMDQKGKLHDQPHITDAEEAAYVAWWRSMTPRQRLESGR